MKHAANPRVLSESSEYGVPLKEIIRFLAETDHANLPSQIRSIRWYLRWLVQQKEECDRKYQEDVEKERRGECSCQKVDYSRSSVGIVFRTFWISDPPRFTHSCDECILPNKFHSKFRSDKHELNEGIGLLSQYLKFAQFGVLQQRLLFTIMLSKKRSAETIAMVLFLTFYYEAFFLSLLSLLLNPKGRYNEGPVTKWILEIFGKNTTAIYKKHQINESNICNMNKKCLNCNIHEKKMLTRETEINLYYRFPGNMNKLAWKDKVNEIKQYMDAKACYVPGSSGKIVAAKKNGNEKLEHIIRLGHRNLGHGVGHDRLYVKFINFTFRSKGKPQGKRHNNGLNIELEFVQSDHDAYKSNEYKFRCCNNLEGTHPNLKEVELDKAIELNMDGSVCPSNITY